MASTIQIKRGTGSAVPSGLADGELAINLDNGQLYFGSGSTSPGGSTSVNSFTFKNLTAENYIVSSSVTHLTTQTLSGSTTFGDDAVDVHNRTGSFNISGALNLVGEINAASAVLTTADINGGTIDGITSLTAGGNLDIGAHELRASTFESDVSTGTAPFTVASTTEVANLHADTATTLHTARTINGVSFDGSANITVTAAGSTLSNTVTVAKGGTGATSFADKSVIITQDSGTDTLAAVAMSTNGQLLIGGTSGPAVAVPTGGDGLTVTVGDGTLEYDLDAALTTVTSVVNSSLEIGRDADNRIKFGTDNQIIFEVSGGDNVIFKASGEIEASSLDISGDVDIAGTTNLDAVDIDGNVQLTGTLIVGVDDAGHDVTLFGNTSNKFVKWDASQDQLKLYDNTNLVFGTGQFNEADFDASIFWDTSDLVIDSETDIKIVADGGNVDVTGEITATGNIIAQGASSIIQAIDTTLNYVVELKGEGGPKINWGDTDISTDAFMTMGAYSNINQIDTAARDFHLYGTNTTTGFYFDESAGTFGVGTITPPEKLTIEGNISASGTVFTDTISSPSNNLIISSSTVKITSTTDGEANLILESDSDNNDENDNPFMLFTQDGGAINGYLGLIGDADKWPDGGTLTGVTGNGLVLGTKGPTTSTNSQLFLAAGDAVRLTILNDGKVGIGTTTPSQELEVAGDIKLSGELLSNSDMLYTADANGDGAGKHTFRGTSATLLELSGVSASFTVPVKDAGRTIVKILPHNFVPNDGGRPVQIEDDSIGSNELFLHSHSDFDMYAYIEIPYGMTATHVKIFGSNTGENFTVYEANFNTKTIAAKCSATAINSLADITDVPWTDSNYLVILVTSAGATDEIHGGYVKIEPS